MLKNALEIGHINDTTFYRRAKSLLEGTTTLYRMTLISEAIFQKKLKNVKLNINNVCNLISVSSEHFN